jgi:hypothetical protein
MTITLLNAVMIAEGVQEATPQDQLRAWAQLIQSGHAWNLQGFFGRTASDLINAGLISPDGQVDWDAAGLDPDAVYYTANR